MSETIQIEKQYIKLNGLTFIAEPVFVQLSLEATGGVPELKKVYLSENEFFYGDLSCDTYGFSDTSFKVGVNGELYSLSFPELDFKRKMFFDNLSTFRPVQFFFNGLKLRLLGEFEPTLPFYDTIEVYL
ncbi:hypothetical protein P8625_02945 [Tenacibaculum tangerinum]|uniref:Uncharacterized protein n=1 Tax=Tenacibaculum tangerinum TaxID=3038772 RepID=A0ABY8L4Y6_9FLAO|nr:hypothetical protein [Tenacibaculum tangerinum]WGH76141.1 hypothetical protein P8625_02945 [Tenacibaculum tangerinum]